MAELAELFLPMPDPERTHRPVVQNHLGGGNSRFFRVTVASEPGRAELSIKGFLAGGFTTVSW